MIKNAWKKAGLSPWDPHIVIGKLPINIDISTPPVTPPKAGLIVNGVKTPTNLQQISELFQVIKNIDPRVEKLGKAALHAASFSETQEAVNEQIIKASQRNQRRKGNKQGTYGKARVMSSEVVKERQLAKEQQEKEDTLKYQQKEEAKKQKVLDKIQQAKIKEEAKVYKLIAQARERGRKENEKKAFAATGFIRHLFELPIRPLATPRAPRITAAIPHRAHISDTLARPEQPVLMRELSPTPVATQGGRIIRKPRRLLE